MAPPIFMDERKTAPRRARNAMSTVRKNHWERIYSGKAERELGWFQERPTVSLELIARSSLPPDARIVDVGGGASRLVDCLLAGGYTDVTVLDVAEAPLAQARRRLGPQAARVTWIVADVTEWKPPAPFDLWHDRAVFHFLTDPDDRDAYRNVLRRAVRPGGIAIIGTFALDGPERCSGLPVVRYSPQSLRDELGAGFELLDGAADGHQTPGGAVQRFQFARLRLAPEP
jgi:SAM-dependent methyltransferase